MGFAEHEPAGGRDHCSSIGSLAIPSLGGKQGGDPSQLIHHQQGGRQAPPQRGPAAASARLVRWMAWPRPGKRRWDHPSNRSVRRCAAGSSRPSPRPRPPRRQAWPAIAAGENVLLSAPTGSGKTLAAFLWALDRLSTGEPGPAGDAARGLTRVVYVSPLKALAYDIERNLRAPLRGIGADITASGSAPATRRSASARRCCATRPTS